MQVCIWKGNGNPGFFLLDGCYDFYLLLLLFLDRHTSIHIGSEEHVMKTSTAEDSHCPSRFLFAVHHCGSGSGSDGWQIHSGVPKLPLRGNWRPATTAAAATKNSKACNALQSQPINEMWKKPEDPASQGNRANGAHEGGETQFVRSPAYVRILDYPAVQHAISRAAVDASGLVESSSECIENEELHQAPTHQEGSAAIASRSSSVSSLLPPSVRDCASLTSDPLCGGSTLCDGVEKGTHHPETPLRTQHQQPEPTPPSAAPTALVTSDRCQPSTFTQDWNRCSQLGEEQRWIYEGGVLSHRESVALRRELAMMARQLRERDRAVAAAEADTNRMQADRLAETQRCAVMKTRCQALQELTVELQCDNRALQHRLVAVNVDNQQRCDAALIELLGRAEVEKADAFWRERWQMMMSHIEMNDSRHRLEGEQWRQKWRTADDGMRELREALHRLTMKHHQLRQLCQSQTEELRGRNLEDKAKATLHSGSLAAADGGKDHVGEEQSPQSRSWEDWERILQQMGDRQAVLLREAKRSEDEREQLQREHATRIEALERRLSEEKERSHTLVEMYSAQVSSLFAQLSGLRDEKQRCEKRLQSLRATIHDA